MVLFDKTFIVLKPDAIRNPVICKFVVYLTKKLELHFTNEDSIKLTKNMIRFIWENETVDVVSRQLMFFYLSGKKLPILFFEGKDAIKKSTLIKKIVRSKYGKSHYSNCIHTPSDEKEYFQNILTFNQIAFIYENKVADCYINRLDADRLMRCSTLLWGLLNNIDFNIFCSSVYQICLKWKLCLIIDKKQKLYELVEFLLKYDLSWDIEILYLMIYAADWLGEFPIMSSDEYNKLHKLQVYLNSYNVKTKIFATI
ncbi:MAG: hypothetical protein FWD82_04370 [Defluviitaleaceae bacterium]|nr:hypothetical protein [Defluviitaleaceae bacterium]